MSVDLWCAGVEHRDGGLRLRWRSSGLVLMDREWWRASVGSWLMDQSIRVTSRGGWHLGHALARGLGGVDRVSSVVENWRDTRLVVEDVQRGAVLTTSLVVWASKLPSATDGKFCWVWASKLDSDGSRGNRWRHVAWTRRVRQGEASPREGRGRRIKNLGVDPFRAPVEWIGSI
jgi:hypothetical protein